LIEIAGKSLIQHVYERVVKVDRFTDVIVATDDDRIFDHVENFGGQVLMTKPDHQSGTERMLEVAERMGDYDIYINVQGDEPLIPEKLLTAIIERMSTEDIMVFTAATSLIEKDIQNPNIVKLVKDNNDRALYFSRAPIPYARSGQWISKYHLKHIGVYFFTAKTIDQIRKLDAHPLEKYESLEQLRWLLNGIPIYIHTTDYKAIGVDTKEDLEKVRKILEEK
jgi:3-deoxy-manno-octulosonate cytidylyltransferase (CMP-KDO synthetase)